MKMNMIFINIIAELCVYGISCSILYIHIFRCDIYIL